MDRSAYHLRSLSGKLLSWADTPAKESQIFMRMLHGLVRLLLITFREFRKNDLPLRSAALTYTILLSLVPILAMSTAVVKGLGGGDQLREVAYRYIATLEQDLPATVPDQHGAQPGDKDMDRASQDSAGLTRHLHDAIDQLFNYVDQTNFATLGSFGVAGILVSVILVFGNIELALNAIWHVDQSRSIIRKIADYITLLVLMPISINVALAASAFLTSPTLAAHFQLFIPFPWMQTLVLKLVPVFAIAITFYVIYVFFPNIRVHTTPAILGAALAAILWFVVQNIYIRLQIGVSNYNAIYGSFATLPLFLVWMYLGWLFVLTGAQVAYACQHINSYRLLPTTAEPVRRLSAAFDIMDMVQSAHATNHPLMKEDLEILQRSYTKALIEEVEDTLVKAKLLHISPTTEWLLPSGPAAAIGYSPVIEAILGTRVPDTPGGNVARDVLDKIHHSPEGLQIEGSSETDSGSLQDGQSST